MADGSINIDTRIDTAGFNAGTSNIAAKATTTLKGILGSLGNLGVKVVDFGLNMWQSFVGFMKKIAISVGFILLLGSMRIGSFIKKSLQGMRESNAAIGAEMAALDVAMNNMRGALLGIFITLLQVAMPVILRIINWLTVALNFIAQVIAALTGATTYTKYVAGNLDDAAGSAGGLAKNTKKAKDEAKGALAAFDEINVLAEDAVKNPPTPDLGTGTAPGTGPLDIAGVTTPIDPGILSFIDNVKAKWKEFTNLWDSFRQNWDAFWQGKPLPAQWAQDLRDLGLAILIAAGIILLLFLAFNAEAVGAAIATGATAAFGAVMAFLTSPIVLIIAGIIALIAIIYLLIKHWPEISAAAQQALDWIIQKWNAAGPFFSKLGKDIATWFSNTVAAIKQRFSEGWDWVVTTWGKAGAWFNGIGKSISDGWHNVWNGIKSFFKGIVNDIIGFINRMVAGAVGGINGLISAINRVHIDIPSILGAPAISIGFNIPTISAPQIPLLATGAVIPPNSQFLAVLGDQRSGRNIEAPESLIRSILQEELGKLQVETTVNFAGSLGALVRELKPYIDKENVRVGSSLVVRTS